MLTFDFTQYDANVARQIAMSRFDNDTDAKEALVKSYERFKTNYPNEHDASFAYEHFQKGLTMVEIERAINTYKGRKGVL